MEILKEFELEKTKKNVDNRKRIEFERKSKFEKDYRKG